MKNQSKKNKPMIAKNNRNKGATLELEVRSKFIELGFVKTKTSRQASRIYDDCAIDHWGIVLPNGRLVFTQCKMGYKSNRPKADVEFRKQIERTQENFEVGSKELDNPLQILFHKIDGYKPENHLVTLKFNDFIEIFKSYVENTKKINTAT